MASRRRPSDVYRALERLGGTAHTSDLLAAGVHPRDLYAARTTGDVAQVSRGVFRLGDLPPTNPDLVTVATRMPRAVICLVSAMHLHGITDEIPRAVWVALPPGIHEARLDHPPLEVVHFSSKSFGSGVEQSVVDGVPFRVTTVAKTIADAFKFRNRIGGIDVAIQALRDALRMHVATPAEIMDAALVCRVQRTVAPFLQAYQ
jgi:predicted transcriptional regulator of viral defense system